MRSVQERTLGGREPGAHGWGRGRGRARGSRGGAAEGERQPGKQRHIGGGRAVLS